MRDVKFFGCWYQVTTVSIEYVSALVQNIVRSWAIILTHNDTFSVPEVCSLVRIRNVVPGAVSVLGLRNNMLFCGGT